MMFELVAFGTDNPREVRERIYTKSRKKADAWGILEKIEFSDSGHGIVHQAYPVESRRGRPEVRRLGYRWDGRAGRWSRGDRVG